MTEYSQRYTDAISQARAFFAERFPAMPEIQISQADFQAGTDSLHRPDIRALLAECFDYMLTQRGYELSYSQQCHAFFGAAGVLPRTTCD